MVPAVALQYLTRANMTVIALSFATSLWLPTTSLADDATSCQLGGDETARVCFADPPLVVNHCDGTISPNFRISRKDDVPYYFSFRVFADLGNGDVALVDPPKEVGHGAGERTYLLTDNDAVTQAGTSLMIPFKGDGTYYIELTVHAKELAPITKTSARISLRDHPFIKSIVVGVSRYDNGADDQASGKPVLNLRHADNDAHAFSEMLKQLFPDSPEPVLLTTDKTSVDALPTPDNIMAELSRAVQDPGLCSENDWFIFYFSGHGVLSSDGRNTQHYLSTKLLDPSNLPSTAVWIGDLLTKIEHVRAGNKLIVLDSCFSGTTRAPDTASSGGEKGLTISQRPSSSKVQYVYKGKSVGPFQSVNDPDAHRPATSMNNIDFAGGRALFLAAAKSDHEAEEGFEKPKPTGGIVFTPSDLESPEQKEFGHGLYTFSLVWTLESLLPKQLKYKEVLGGDLHLTSDSDQCTLDFMAARSLVNGDFVNKIERTSGSDLQKPDSTQTPQDLPSIKCMLPPVDRGFDVQPNH